MRGINGSMNRKGLLETRKKNVKYGVLKDGENTFYEILDAFVDGKPYYEFELVPGFSKSDVEKFLGNSILKGMYQIGGTCMGNLNGDNFYLYFANSDGIEKLLSE